MCIDFQVMVVVVLIVLVGLPLVIELLECVEVVGVFLVHLLLFEEVLFRGLVTFFLFCSMFADEVSTFGGIVSTRYRSCSECTISGHICCSSCKELCCSSSVLCVLALQVLRSRQVHSVSQRTG